MEAKTFNVERRQLIRFQGDGHIPGSEPRQHQNPGRDASPPSLGAVHQAGTCDCAEDCGVTQERLIKIMAFTVVLWQLVRQHEAEVTVSVFMGKGEGHSD